jgi:hypothetical protein
MTKHQIEIKIIGSGKQIFLYEINDVALNEFLKSSKSNHKLKYHEILNSCEGVECHHVFYGMDIFDRTLDMTFICDGESTKVRDVLNITDFDYDQSSKIKNCFVYDDQENIETLEGSLLKGKHMIVVAEDYNDGVLNTIIKADEPIRPEDLRLEFISLDGPSDFSECTYHLGTSGSLEYELKSFLYKGKSYEVDFSCSNFKSLNIYLITRNESSVLYISPLSEELFS